MMKKIFSVLLAGVCLQVNAQNHEDIFRYSNQQVVGSVRTMGLSGAWGAAGADLSSASYNPAGIGLYRRNEWMGSMAFTVNRSSTDFNGNPMIDNRTMFNIPNFGMVFNSTTPSNGAQKAQGVIGGSLALGMNRINDFQSNIAFSGTVKNSSVGDYLARMAYGTDTSAMWGADYDNTLFALARRVNLIYNDTAGNQFGSWQRISNDTDYTMFQYQQLQSRGRMNEWYVTGGLNISNFLYLGGSLVIDHAVYTHDNNYSETLKKSSVVGNKYKSSLVNQHVETRGTGVGGKFGMILRPADFIRLGASYHTPIRMNMRDDYYNSVTMNFTDGTSYTEPLEKRIDYYEYQIITPSRFTSSASIIVGKILILNADYERIDFTKGRLQSKDVMTDFMDANNVNKQVFAVAQNYKVGMEVCGRYTRYRAGYALLGSPYNSAVLSAADGNKHLLSVGFGWVYDDAYFFDIAVNDRIGKDFLTPYDGSPVTVTNETHKLNFSFGMGCRF